MRYVCSIAIPSTIKGMGGWLIKGEAGSKHESLEDAQQWCMSEMLGHLGGEARCEVRSLQCIAEADGGEWCYGSKSLGWAIRSKAHSVRAAWRDR